MKNKLILMTSALVLCLSHPIFAQEKEDESYKKLSIIPMPVISASPTTGLMFGIAPGVSWFSGHPSKTSMSNFLSSFLYTTNKQILMQARGNMFLEDDKWLLTSDFRFNLNSQPTYGLGTNPKYADQTLVEQNNTKGLDDLLAGPKASEMMKFTHLRLYQTVMKRHEDTRFFYGLGYHLDAMSNIKDQELETKAGTETYHHEYQTAHGLPTDKYTQSGVSLNALYDSRDNVANPYSGEYALATFRINPEALGSTKTATQLWLEYRNYFPLNKERPRHMIAVWTFGSFVTGGKVPYMFLPATGWDMFGRSARPYTLGRFRGEDLQYTEVEWRIPLQKNKEKFGAVVFVNNTFASSRQHDIGLFNTAQLGYGAGFRYMLSEKNRVNISVDYGRGHNGASGVFLNLNEAF